MSISNRRIQVQLQFIARQDLEGQVHSLACGLCKSTRYQPSPSLDGLELRVQDQFLVHSNFTYQKWNQNTLKHRNRPKKVNKLQCSWKTVLWTSTKQSMEMTIRVTIYWWPSLHLIPSSLDLLKKKWTKLKKNLPVKAQWNQTEPW